MSEPNDTKPEPDEPGAGPSERRDEPGDPGLDEVDVRDLLRAALRPPPGAVAPNILPGVQKRIRARSRGKFYGDGWSTAQTPRSTYFITSLIMLALILVILFVLVPWGVDALR